MVEHDQRRATARECRTAPSSPGRVGFDIEPCLLSISSGRKRLVGSCPGQLMVAKVVDQVDRRRTVKVTRTRIEVGVTAEALGPGPSRGRRRVEEPELLVSETRRVVFLVRFKFTRGTTRLLMPSGATSDGSSNGRVEGRSRGRVDAAVPNGPQTDHSGILKLSGPQALNRLGGVRSQGGADDELRWSRPRPRHWARVPAVLAGANPPSEQYNRTRNPETRRQRTDSFVLAMLAAMRARRAVSRPGAANNPPGHTGVNTYGSPPACTGDVVSTTSQSMNGKTREAARSQFRSCC